MTVTAKRHQLISYLSEMTDKKVSALYSLVEDEMKAREYVLTAEQIELLEQREADFNAGKSGLSSWQDVHMRVRGQNNNG